jgi:hemerythrin-like domain-containing protein
LQAGVACGLVSVTGVSVTGGAFARDTKKKGAEEAISAPEDLMREHAILGRLLLIYESAMRRLGQGEDIDPAVLEQSARIALQFVHDYHEKSEEELVFPRFKTAGRMVELVNILVVQHAAGRKLTERILAAAPQARNRQPREDLARDIQAFSAMYRPHTAREDTDIFPTLRSLVTADEYEEIADQLEKRERQAFGADGFEKIAKKVAEVETVIGIHDLEVFTPKS